MNDKIDELAREKRKIIRKEQQADKDNLTLNLQNNVEQLANYKRDAGMLETPEQPKTPKVPWDPKENIDLTASPVSEIKETPTRKILYQTAKKLDLVDGPLEKYTKEELLNLIDKSADNIRDIIQIQLKNNKMVEQLQEKKPLKASKVPDKPPMSNEPKPAYTESPLSITQPRMPSQALINATKEQLYNIAIERGLTNKAYENITKRQLRTLVKEPREYYVEYATTPETGEGLASFKGGRKKKSTAPKPRGVKATKKSQLFDLIRGYGYSVPYKQATNAGMMKYLQKEAGKKEELSELSEEAGNIGQSNNVENLLFKFNTKVKKAIKGASISRTVFANLKKMGDELSGMNIPGLKKKKIDEIMYGLMKKVT